MNGNPNRWINKMVDVKTSNNNNNKKKMKIKMVTWRITRNNETHRCDLFWQFHGWYFFFAIVKIHRSSPYVKKCVRTIKICHAILIEFCKAFYLCSCSIRWDFFLLLLHSVHFTWTASYVIAAAPYFTVFSIIILFCSSKFNLTWDSYPNIFLVRKIYNRIYILSTSQSFNLLNNFLTIFTYFIQTHFLFCNENWIPKKK